MWFKAAELEAGARTPVERRHARIGKPVPRNIGCPYGASRFVWDFTMEMICIC